MHIPMTPKVILDLKGLIQHSYYGATDNEHGTRTEEGKIINSAGFGVQAFYERYLKQILTNFAPINIIGVWDDGRQWRTRIYSDYKAHRDAGKSKEDPRYEQTLQQVYAGVRELLSSLGAYQVKVAHTEADDVIAFLCERLPCNKIVYTNDSDLLQLQTDQTQVDAADCLGAPDAFSCDVIVRGEVFTESYKEIPLPLLRFAKATIGDKSDGYNGVHGFGEAAFGKLLANYGVEGLLKIEKALADEKTGKVAKLAEQYQDKELQKILDQYREFRLSYTLAGLNTRIIDTVIDNEIRAPIWRRRIPSAERARKSLEPLGVGYLVEELRQFFPTRTLVTAATYDKARMWMGKQLLKTREPVISFDYESYDPLKHEPFQRAKSQNSGEYVDVLSQVITGVSVNFGDNLQHTLYFSFRHADTDNIDPARLPELMQQLSSLPSHKLAAHNAEFERTVCLLNTQVDVAPLIDTQAMLAYVDENNIEAGENGLKPSSKRMLNYDQITYEQVLAGRPDMTHVTGQEVLEYGCDDALVTSHLRHFSDIILALEGQRDFFYSEEPYVIAPLSDRLIAGIVVDFDEMKVLRSADQKVIDNNSARLNALLASHCGEKNEAAAAKLYEIEAPYYRAKFADDAEKMQAAFDAGTAKSAPQHDYVQAKLTRVKDKMIQLSAFTLPQEVEAKWDFIPTAAKIKEVLAAIGAGEVWLEQMPKSFTPGTIAKWVRNVCIADGAEPAGQLGEFARLLGAAAPQVKEREGDEYTALKVFCEKAVVAKMGKQVVGTSLNLNSPDQMKALLYCMLELPVRVQSKVQQGSWRQAHGFDGGPATDIKALEMAVAHDASDPADWKNQVLESIKAIRKAEKRFEMYYDKYLLWVHPRDGRIHPGIKNNGTMTRRPSGSNPNILQISKVKAEGDVPIRSMYLPLQPDHVFVDPDFDGQELRIMASESKDIILTDAYIGPVRKDIHSLTAAAISAVLLPRIDRELAEELRIQGLFCERGELGFFGVEPMFFMANRSDGKYAKAFKTIRDKYAKPANFLIIYGGGGQTLARNIGCDVALAYDIMDMVFKAYPGIKPWQQSVADYARQNGFVLTAYGTRKHVSRDIFGNDDGKRKRAERQAINQTIQGCAADMLKQVIRTSVDQRLFTEFNATLVAPIYDEVLFSVPAHYAVEFSKQLMQIMRITPPGHSIPMEPALTIALSNFHGDINEKGKNIGEFGTNPNWDSVAAHVAKKEPSKARFYLPSWYKEAA